MSNNDEILHKQTEPSLEKPVEHDSSSVSDDDVDVDDDLETDVEILSDEESDEESGDDENEEENESIYVLSGDNKPIRYSTELKTLTEYRDYLIKREVAKYINLGLLYVSHNKTLRYQYSKKVKTAQNHTVYHTAISYRPRSVWNIEQTLKTFTIHRINKI
jgi:hypothetical protein